MSAPIKLTPEQKKFLEHACAFIATSPPQHELDQLLTLAVMLLPDPLPGMLEKRAAVEGSLGIDDPQLTSWLQ